MTTAQLLHSVFEKYATQPGASAGPKPPAAPATPTGGGLNSGGLNKGLSAGPAPAGGLSKPLKPVTTQPAMQPAAPAARPLPPTYERWPDGGPKPHHIQQLIADGKELGAREDEITQRKQNIVNMMNNFDPLGERTPARQQPQQTTAPDWIKPEYRDAIGAPAGQRKYMYFPNDEGFAGAGGRVVETATGRIVQTNMPDREGYLQRLMGGAGNAAQATPPATTQPAAQPAPNPTTPILSTPASTLTPQPTPAAPAPAPASPQPIVSNTQGTMTDVTGKPVETVPPRPSGPAAFVDTLKQRSDGKEPTGGVIDMTKPLDVNTIAGQFKNPNLNSEQKTQLATDLATKLKNENPQYYEGFQDIQAGRTDTEAAKAYQGRLQQAQDEFVQQQVQADPQKAATPQGFGEIVNGAMSTFQNMHPAMQAMVGIGLPVGLIGIMSSMFGEGGMGMGILGALGLGAGVLGGAAGGMFGQGASNMVGDAMYNMGSFLGMVPEAREGSLDALKGDNPIQSIIKGQSKGHDGWIGPKVETVKKQLEDGRKQVGQLRQLMALPVGNDAKIRLMQRLDPSIKSVEDAQKIFANAGTVLNAYDDPKSELSQHIQKGERYVESPWSVIGEEVSNFLPSASAWANQAGDGTGFVPPRAKGASMNMHTLIEKWAFNDMDAKELSDIKAEKAKGAPYRVEDARREHELNLRNQATAPVEKKLVVMCMKSARCWAGYEPVPGKKPYSNDSCRPVGSKKKDSKKKAK